MVKIDKKYLIAGAAVLAILMFLMEPFQWASSSYKTPVVTPSGQNVSGVTRFNGTIRTYDPMLIIPLDTDQSVISQIRLHDGVKDVQQKDNSYAVTTDTRDDVYPLSAWLRSLNVTSYAIANVAVNEAIVVQTAAGNVSTFVPSGVVRVVAEPLLDADSDVTVSMAVVMRDNTVIDYSSASFTMQEVEMLVDARVDSLRGKVYTYSIPWESRNSVGDLSGLGDVEYDKIDSIVFSPPLSVGQIQVKRLFPYITYIDSGSAQVEPSFDNATELAVNFADTPYILPPSALTLITNGTPDIGFEPDSVRYRYALSITDTQYDFGPLNPLEVEGNGDFEENGTLQLNVSALTLGNRIISVRRVSLPS